MARARLHRFLLAATCGVLLLLAGCGEEGEEDVGITPAPRHGPEAADRFEAVEQVRARLVSVSGLTAAGRRLDARPQIEGAREAWSEISPAVAAEDAVLAREISAALDAIDDELGAGTTFDDVRDLVAPLGTQLLDGATQLLLDREARDDPALDAEVLVRLVEDLAAESDPARAWGLLIRSQSLARGIVTELGPRRDAVVNGLKSSRELFAEGAASPRIADPAELDRRAGSVLAAVRERFEAR